MADKLKLKYTPSDNYTISLGLHNGELIKFPDYDGKIRTLSEAKKELNDLVKQLTTNPFGKVKFTILMGYESDSFMDRSRLFNMVDEVIRNHRQSNIRIETSSANISYNA